MRVYFFYSFSFAYFVETNKQTNYIMENKEKIKGITPAQAHIIQKSKIWEAWDDEIVVRVVAGQSSDIVPGDRWTEAMENVFGLQCPRGGEFADFLKFASGVDILTLEKYGLMDDEDFRALLPGPLLSAIGYPEDCDEDYLSGLEEFREFRDISESELSEINALAGILN